MLCSSINIDINVSLTCRLKAAVINRVVSGLFIRRRFFSGIYTAAKIKNQGSLEARTFLYLLV